MRYILTAFINCLSFIAFAQTSFEGKIVYAVTSPEKNGTAELIIHFGNTNLKIEFKEPEKELSEVAIISLDSAKIFSVNTDSKTYTVKSLIRFKTTLNPKFKNIAGHPTTHMRIPGLGTNENDAYLRIFLSNSKFYIADSLYYDIPAELEDNLELIVVQNGKIALGAEFFLSDSYEKGEKDSIGFSPTFTIVAKEIVPMKLDSNFFTIPADYEKKSNYRDAPVVTDSIDSVMTPQIMEDSVAVPYNEPAIKKKKPTQKKKTTTRQNATRRKEE